jgi:hypothetical protein
VKNKTENQLFDGRDIIHTYKSFLYEVEIDKKHADSSIFENIKGMMFGTAAF